MRGGHPYRRYFKNLRPIPMILARPLEENPKAQILVPVGKIGHPKTSAERAPEPRSLDSGQRVGYWRPRAGVQGHALPQRHGEAGAQPPLFLFVALDDLPSRCCHKSHTESGRVTKLVKSQEGV